MSYNIWKSSESGIEIVENVETEKEAGDAVLDCYAISHSEEDYVEETFWFEVAEGEKAREYQTHFEKDWELFRFEGLKLNKVF